MRFLMVDTLLYFSNNIKVFSLTFIVSLDLGENVMLSWDIGVNIFMSVIFNLYNIFTPLIFNLYILCLWYLMFQQFWNKDFAVWKQKQNDIIQKEHFNISKFLMPPLPAQYFHLNKTFQHFSFSFWFEAKTNFSVSISLEAEISVARKFYLQLPALQAWQPNPSNNSFLRGRIFSQ